MTPENQAKVDAAIKALKDAYDASDGTAGDGFHGDKLVERIVPDSWEAKAKINPSIWIFGSFVAGGVVCVALFVFYKILSM